MTQAILIKKEKKKKVFVFRLNTKQIFSFFACFYSPQTSRCSDCVQFICVCVTAKPLTGLKSVEAQICQNKKQMKGLRV